MTHPTPSAPRVTADPVASGRDTALRVAAELPRLRRYARALTGSQTRGDRHAAATLEAIIADRSLLDGDANSRVALFRAFHQVWSGSGEGAGTAPDTPVGPAEAAARARLAALTAHSREALLLRCVEEFRTDEIARIMEISPEGAQDLIACALREMQAGVPGQVMIIEDEPLIAMDIADIVADMGHGITGIARTHGEAVALGRSTRPDLILADIQLADNSSGIEAVNALLRDLGELPVVFITAFPERLLTGEKPEPAFLITKPFTAEQVRAAVSQAVFFASTETLLQP